MTPNAIQIVKMLTGSALALACLALVAFETKLGLHPDPTRTMILLGMVVGGGVLGGQGAVKFQPSAQNAEPKND